ncbi:hypothetical protein Tco_0599319 [Tanacetum coccineum]
MIRTQQDIYSDDSENRHPMLNKENYVPCSSRLLRCETARKSGYVCPTNDEKVLYLFGIQEKKAKLFNEWERFTSTDGESIESYYHRFSKLMNDFKRNKHFPEKIASVKLQRIGHHARNLQSDQDDGMLLSSDSADLDEIEEISGCGTKRGTEDQHTATVKEHVLLDSLFNNWPLKLKRSNSAIGNDKEYKM